MRTVDLAGIDKQGLADLVNRNPALLQQMAAAACRARCDVDGAASVDPVEFRLASLGDYGRSLYRAKCGNPWAAVAPIADQLGDFDGQGDTPEVAAEVRRRMTSVEERLRTSIQPGLLAASARQASLLAALKPHPDAVLPSFGQAPNPDVLSGDSRPPVQPEPPFRPVDPDRLLGPSFTVRPSSGVLPPTAADLCPTWGPTLAEDVENINDKIVDRIGPLNMYGVDYPRCVVEMNRQGWTAVCEPDVVAGSVYSEQFEALGGVFAAYSSGWPGHLWFRDSFERWVGTTFTSGAILLSRNDVKRWRRGIVVHELVHMIDYEILYEQLGIDCPWADCGASPASGHDDSLTEYTASFVQYRWMGFSSCVADAFADGYWRLTEELTDGLGMVTSIVWDVLSGCVGLGDVTIILLLSWMLTGGAEFGFFFNLPGVAAMWVVWLLDTLWG